ncbi:MAG: hypothetical protein M3Y85_12315 [Bacteroidota bacterium]|nr:hypothetical protein [Bacteroidota bacterium]
MALAVFNSFCSQAQDGGANKPDTMPAPAHEKNVERTSFLPISQQQNIEEKKVPAKLFDNLKSDEDYWYANLAPHKKKDAVQPPGKTLFDEVWFNNLFWLFIILSFITVVIWYLMSSNIQLFRKASKNIFVEEESDRIEDIFSLNFDNEIARSSASKNYRLAVRFWYLYMLKQLSEKNLINYSNEKTNSDYLNTLSGGVYYKDFFKLTRNFEYIWYGQFPLSEEGYSLLQKEFASFKNSLR